MRHILDYFELVMFGAIPTTAFVVLGFIANMLFNLVRGRFPENWPLPQSPWSLTFFIVLLGIPLGMFLQDSWMQYVLTFASLVGFVAPCLGLLGLVALLFWIRGHRIPAALKGWVLVLAACIPALALSYGVGLAFHQWEINAACAYVERAMPVLDGIKMKTGSYPTILPVSTLGSPPRLLHKKGSYTSDGKEFHFYYPDPANILGEGSEFDSTSRTWRYSNDWLD